MSVSHSSSSRCWFSSAWWVVRRHGSLLEDNGFVHFFVVTFVVKFNSCHVAIVNTLEVRTIPCYLLYIALCCDLCIRSLHIWTTVIRRSFVVFLLFH